ncbi:MAG: hypothetical protein ACLP3K_16005 [Candidatus Acidiferrales bacterium]
MKPPLPDIQKALGHKSLACAGVYLNLTDAKADREIAKAFTDGF